MCVCVCVCVCVRRCVGGMNLKCTTLAYPNISSLRTMPELYTSTSTHIHTHILKPFKLRMVNRWGEQWILPQSDPTPISETGTNIVCGLQIQTSTRVSNGRPGAIGETSGGHEFGRGRALEHHFLSEWVGRLSVVQWYSIGWGPWRWTGKLSVYIGSNYNVIQVDYKRKK